MVHILSTTARERPKSYSTSPFCIAVDTVSALRRRRHGSLSSSRRTYDVVLSLLSLILVAQLVSIDVNKVAEVPQRQKIRDLPTIQFFVEGKEVGSYVATDRGEVFYGNMERHLRNALGEDVA